MTFFLSFHHQTADAQANQDKARQDSGDESRAKSPTTSVQSQPTQQSTGPSVTCEFTLQLLPNNLN